MAQDAETQGGGKPGREPVKCRGGGRLVDGAVDTDVFGQPVFALPHPKLLHGLKDDGVDMVLPGKLAKHIERP